MKILGIFFLTSVIFLCGEICNAQQGFVDGVELTTIKAPWTLRIMGHDLDIANVQAKPNAQSGYFMMTNAPKGLNVSVFIEPVDKCKSSEECRDYVLNLGNPAWGKFQDPAKGKIKDFSYFEFYRPEVKGKPLKMLDMYAQYVSDGYWVDLHISKVLYEKKDHKMFEDLVNSVRFVKKNDGADVVFTSQKSKAESGSTSWFQLWDNKKCGETFQALSLVSRADITKDNWVEYCSMINDEFGQKRSRALIAVAYTHSRTPKTDRPLAIHAYHSSFAKVPSVVEMIALVLEKEGHWTVSNYLLP